MLYNLLISTSSFNIDRNEKLLKDLKNKNFDISFNESGEKLSEDKLIDIISKYDAIIAGTENYTEKVLNSANKLKIISRLGVGLDNIDLKIAEKKNIKIMKTKTSPGLAVAELCLCLTLDILRKVTLHNNDLKQSIWSKNMGNLLSGKTLGIVGLGVIGKMLIKLLSGFNLDILAHDLNVDSEFAKENNIRYVSLKKLFSASDIISVHLNLTENTYQIINKFYLDLMKKHSIIINASRGGIIDEEALYQKLKEGSILGAGLDVFEAEPYDGKLKNLPNVILTPHIGSYAQEIRDKMEEESISNLINMFPF